MSSLALLATVWCCLTRTPVPSNRQVTGPAAVHSVSAVLHVPSPPPPAARDTTNLNELLARIASPDPVTRAATAAALGRIHHPHELVIPDIQKLLHDDAPVVRVAAAEALGGFGPAASNAVADLLEVACETGDAVSRAAALAVLRLEDQAAIRTLIDRLEEDGTNALPVLRVALDHPAAIIRHQALQTLQRIDPVAFPPPGDAAPDDAGEQRRITAARMAADRLNPP